MNIISVSILLGLFVIGIILSCFFVFNFYKKKYLLANELIEIKKQLHDEHNRFETIFEQSSTGVALLSLEGHFLRVNNALCDLLGYSEVELLKMNYHELLHPDDSNHLQTNAKQLLDKKINLYQSEYPCLRKTNETVWIKVTLSLMLNDGNNPAYFILQIENITLQKKAEERLHHMAYHDTLTGLPNRNKLEQFINHLLAAARRHPQNFALLFLDLDRFKNINDSIGHDAGDLLLQIVAERLRGTIRDTDIVARLGGDEFVILVTNVKKTESVAVIAQKILNIVMQAMVIKGQEIYITTSVGISLYPYDGQTLQSLMKNADLALYRAKDHGRNNYQFYTLEMTNKAQEKLTLQNALGHSLAKNEFLLHYQPQMDIKTHKITCTEALLRWENKEYASITPDAIIKLVEENGLIIPVSQWVVKTACKQLKHWHNLGFTSLKMAVNCSIKQFKHATFVDEILALINEIGLLPSSLEVELTEGTIMKDPENTLRILYALKDLGVQIAIDNFGTGYWSLSNLRRLSVDKIKIDKSFIKQITLDESSAAITSAIIGMINKLNIISVAEGVETREQFEFLDKEGCREIQGYYLSAPLVAESMTKYLEHPVPNVEKDFRMDTTT